MIYLGILGGIVMNYIISDILDKIQTWYFEFLPEKEEIFESSILEENEDEEDVSYDEDAFVYVYDNIMELSLSNYEEFSDIVSLLTLEYFNIICSDEFKPNEEDIQTLNLLKEYNKEEFIDMVQNSEEDILFDMLSLILEYYEIGDIEMDFSFYSYDNMEKTYKSNFGKKLYKEFHPNLYGELNVLNNQKQQKKFVKDIDKLEITLVFNFIYYLLVYKQLLREELLSSHFQTKLIELKRKNNTLYKNILSYLIGYYYIVMDKNIIDENDEELGEERCLLEDIKNGNLEYIFECAPVGILISNFINYDFIEYDKLLNESSDEVKTLVKKLNGNNSSQNK